MDSKLIELVKVEAAKLRDNLTVDEAKQLSFKNLDPDNVNYCIYGQATGNCYSPRAGELIRKCAPRVYVGNPDSTELNGKPTKENTEAKLVGYHFLSRRRSHHSPIECFITRATKKQNNNLIKYLKKKTETLDI